MKLGVIAALRSELKPTLAALDALDRPHPFLFGVSGVGAERARTSSLALAPRIDSLISAGFCGALTEELGIGDLLLGGTTGYEASPHLIELAKRACGHRIGGATMADHVVVDAEEKRELTRATGALVVDMESAAVGRVARELGKQFLCAKVVLDTPSQPLASTYSSGGRVAIDILRRPWIIGRMIGDGQRAKLAAEKLREFFVAFRKEIQE